MPKVKKAQPQEAKSQSAPAEPRTATEQIRHNGELVETLLSSEAWQEIVAPLFEEHIAGVSGRKTNGRYHHGSLTREISKDNALMYAGYQKGLMDVWNHIHDFVDAKNNLVVMGKLEAKLAAAPYINPFMEEDGYEVVS